jgi:hypothetical protein
MSHIPTEGGESGAVGCTGDELDEKNRVEETKALVFEGVKDAVPEFLMEAVE